MISLTLVAEAEDRAGLLEQLREVVEEIERGISNGRCGCLGDGGWDFDICRGPAVEMGDLLRGMPDRRVLPHHEDRDDAPSA